MHSQCEQSTISAHRAHIRMQSYVLCGSGELDTHYSFPMGTATEPGSELRKYIRAEAVCRMFKVPRSTIATHPNEAAEDCFRTISCR